MKKQKKITIKPFLNKKVTPAKCTDSDGKESYPLYIQISYNRKNTQIRSKTGLYYKNLNDPALLNLMKFESKILYKVVEYETKEINKLYDLKGLKSKYDVYSIEVRTAVDEFLKERLFKTIKQTNNELMFVLKFKGFKCNFDNLYKAAQLLFDNLPKKMSVEFKQEINAFKLLNKLYPIGHGEYSFPTLIDWKDNSFKSVFEKSLSLELKNNKKEIVETIKIIDVIINDSLKNIVETKKLSNMSNRVLLPIQ